jgi:DNA invertase Pin-like site-specific DNA recombinase
MQMIGYTRVSTNGQELSGAGLDAQEAAIRTECQRRGWELVEIATETGSGKSMKGRPALAQALDALDAGQADGLVAAKLDRVSRSVVDFCKLLERAEHRSWSVVVLDVAVDTSTPSGELMATVVSAFAQYERKLIGQRTKDALAARRAAGAQLGRPRTLDPAVRSRVIVERSAGRSLRAIAADLTQEAVPTAHGGARWHASTIRQITQAA